MSPQTVSVLGCGWLGLPLAAALARRTRVRGSTTSPDRLDDLADAGLVPYRIAVGETVEGTRVGGDDLGAFFGSDVLIVTVPPRGETPYPVVMQAIRDAAERGGTGWVVMTSSTSVYPNTGGTVTESDAGARPGLPLGRRGAKVLAAERVLRESEQVDTTVLRLAGLYGGDRHPARSLAGRRLSGGDAPVNLVHRDDVIGAVRWVLDHDLRSQTLNVCADRHPTRRQLYPAVARALGLDPPVFDEGPGEGFKVVSNERLKRLGYALRHPDPAESR